MEPYTTEQLAELSARLKTVLNHARALRNNFLMRFWFYRRRLILARLVEVSL
jgi:hypothetical protein